MRDGVFFERVFFGSVTLPRRFPRSLMRRGSLPGPPQLAASSNSLAGLTGFLEPPLRSRPRRLFKRRSEDCDFLIDRPGLVTARRLLFSSSFHRVSKSMLGPRCAKNHPLEKNVENTILQHSIRLDVCSIISSHDVQFLQYFSPRDGDWSFCTAWVTKRQA
jgi:hypothetical protein